MPGQRSRRPDTVVRLDKDHGYPELPTDTPDYLRLFYAARRLIIGAARRKKKQP